MNKIVTVALLVLVCGCSVPPDKNAPTTVQIPSKQPDDAAAVQALRDINTAQAAYLQRNRRYALSYDELLDSHLLKGDPSKSASGYDINMHPSPDAESYTAVASPLSRSAEVKSFYMDKSGIIRVERGKEATPSSPPIQ
jgi:hypothetical protein